MRVPILGDRAGREMADDHIAVRQTYLLLTTAIIVRSSNRLAGDVAQGLNQISVAMGHSRRRGNRHPQPTA